MKVAFANRSDCFRHFGGDTVQMLKTKSSLEKLFGYDIEICLTEESLKNSKADIIHVFNIQTIDQTLKYTKVGKEIGCPIVLSTIYWDMTHAFFVNTLSKIQLTDSVFFNSSIKPVFDSFCSLSAHVFQKPAMHSRRLKNKYQLAVKNIDALLPNSLEEIVLLSNWIGIEAPSYFIIPNAIDKEVFGRVVTEKKQRVLPSIICAARIEPVKNQYLLVKSLENFPEIPIKLVGAPGSDKGYVKLVFDIARRRGNVEIIAEKLTQTALADLYRDSTVHVLPSFRESPGLSTLEALSVGLNVVISNSLFCPVATYFSELIGKIVHVCDPYSTSSIRSSIFTALSNDGTGKDTNIKTPTDWDTVADLTNRAYLYVINSIKR